MRRFGFTLAEVLVTLGIIGVVAAMTMPTLVENHQKKVYIVQLQKVYTELAQAAKRVLTDNNAVSLAETRFSLNNENAPEYFLKNYFNLVNDCGHEPTPCFADSYDTLNSTGFDMPFVLTENSYCGTLASGAAICVRTGVSSDEADVLHGGHHGVSEIYVDTNGAKGPNILARDLFLINIYSDGIVGDAHTPLSGDTIEERFEACKDNGWQYGGGCLGKIIQDGWVMDY